MLLVIFGLLIYLLIKYILNILIFIRLKNDIKPYFEINNDDNKKMIFYLSKYS